MAVDYDLTAWLERLKRHCVPLYHPVNADGGSEDLILCGTGIFAKLPSSKKSFLMTASHCIPRSDDGAALPMYVGIDGGFLLPPPLICPYVDHPSEGVDFALFDASSALIAAKGQKEPMRIGTWPTLDPLEGEEVVVVGYTKKRMRTDRNSKSVNMILDAHPGVVSRLERFAFFADAGRAAPYHGALVIDDARGLSGAPCFRVKPLNEIDFELTLCGVHRGAGAGIMTEQTLSAVAKQVDVTLEDGMANVSHEIQAILATSDEISDEMYIYAAEFVTDFRENFPVLIEDESARDDEFKTALLFWAVVLGVLAMEAFESTVVLLKAKKSRGAIMLSRALIDYSVRLRYYILQAEKPLAGLKRNPNIDLKYIRDQVEAWRDWDNSDANLLGIIGLYPHDVYPDKERTAILEGIAKNQQRYDQRFTEMLKVVAKRNRRPESEYHDSTLSAWLMASVFLHGDQAIITDIVREQKKTIYYESPAAFPRTIMMEAVYHMEDILESFAMIRGWNVAGYKWRVKWSRLFVSLIGK